MKIHTLLASLLLLLFLVSPIICNNNVYAMNTGSNGIRIAQAGEKRAKQAKKRVKLLAKMHHHNNMTIYHSTIKIPQKLNYKSNLMANKGTFKYISQKKIGAPNACEAASLMMALSIKNKMPKIGLKKFIANYIGIHKGITTNSGIANHIADTEYSNTPYRHSGYYIIKNGKKKKIHLLITINMPVIVRVAAEFDAKPILVSRYQDKKAIEAEIVQALSHGNPVVAEATHNLGKHGDHIICLTGFLKKHGKPYVQYADPLSKKKDVGVRTLGQFWRGFKKNGKHATIIA